MIITTNQYPNELYHHGILGMHWGVRRYQNEDGTLTPKGKARISKVASSKFKTKYENKVAKSILTNRAASAAVNQLSAEARVKRLSRKHPEQKEEIKKAIKEGKMWADRLDKTNKLINQINEGSLKAGRDFIIQTDYDSYGLFGVVTQRIVSEDKRFKE